MKYQNANLSIEDIMAALLECTVLGIKSAINKLPQKPYSIIVVGGGYKNKFLLKRLKNTLEIKLISQDKLDFSFDYVEAELIAFLSARVINNLATTFPDTTGVKKPIIGGKIFYKNPF